MAATGFDSLPRELLEVIAQRADPVTRAAMACVCNAMRAATEATCANAADEPRNGRVWAVVRSVFIEGDRNEAAALQLEREGGVVIASIVRAAPGVDATYGLEEPGIGPQRLLAHGDGERVFCRLLARYSTSLRCAKVIRKKSSGNAVARLERRMVACAPQRVRLAGGWRVVVV